MTTATDRVDRVIPGPRPPVATGARPLGPLAPWLSTQSVNVGRHLAALRPFNRADFGTGHSSPTEGHIRAVNDLLARLRTELEKRTATVSRQALAATEAPSTQNLQHLTRGKERAHQWVQAVERVWDFYLELFGQRQAHFRDWLVSCDRIALDCYQDVYLGVGVPKSIPAPPPFTYMRTGFSPATYRRLIPLRRLGQQLNPFPLIQLPYHRLVNPWTLGAILHEVSHNFQSELGLARAVPEAMGQALRRAGHSTAIVRTWVRWNRELFADACGLLLGGPSVVGSLFDVIGRSPETVLEFDPKGVHPTPYLRAFISLELLRRMGFPEDAEQYRRMWLKLYPNPRGGSVPGDFLASFEDANRIVVDAVCYRPYAALGNKAMAEVLRFGPKEQMLVDEASRRLAAGTDPGVVPERFLIGAARLGMERRLAPPAVIARNFYTELARR